MPSSTTMSPGEELLMRLLYLIRRTCDQLSRDLMRHVLRVLHWQTWDMFAGDPVCREDFKKYFKKPFGDRIPSLDECDTTTLHKFFKKEATYPHNSLKRNTKFDKAMETIKNFRNSSAHEAKKELTDSEYEENFSQFFLTISELESYIFLSLSDNLQFLRDNKSQTFVHFYPNNEKEIQNFLQGDKNMLMIAKKDEALKQLAENIEEESGRLTKKSKQKMIKLLGQQSISSQFPISNLVNVPMLQGREKDLEKLDSLFKKSQIVLICGPPGIGKTSLALTHAKNMLRRTISDGNQVENCALLFVRMNDLSNLEEMGDSFVRHEIGKKIGSFFPAITKALTEAEDPFDVVLQHARQTVACQKIFLILDNIDTVLEAQSGNVMGKILEELTSIQPDQEVQVLATSRDKRVYSDLVEIEVQEMGPLSIQDCRQWLQSQNQSSNLAQDSIDSISESCGGIPLVLKIIHSVAKRRKNFSADEIPSIETSDDWKLLTKKLNWSFNLLNSDQTSLMKCASAFRGSFEKENLFDLFEKRGKAVSSGPNTLDVCLDLSLVESDVSRTKYFLHPYIKEHIQRTLLKDINELEELNAIYVVTYFQKFMKASADQFCENRFLDVLGKITSDSDNNDNFFKMTSNRNQFQIDVFKKFVKDDNYVNSFWLLNFFRLLDLTGRYKKVSLTFAKELEKIFNHIGMEAHETICKCFIAHQLRLRNIAENLLQSREIITEASQLCNSLTTPVKLFCDGYVHYTMARFIQQTRKCDDWKRSHQWENIAADDHFSITVNCYQEWQKLCDNVDSECLRVTAQKMELYRVLLFQFSEKLDQAKSESEKDEYFDCIGRIATKVERSLGRHDFVAFTHKKHADNLKYNKRLKPACEKYAKAYKMYGLLGTEIRTQQITVLRDWSDCIEDKKDALEKLHAAELILKENCMEFHNWYTDIQNRINKCQDSVGAHLAVKPN